MRVRLVVVFYYFSTSGQLKQFDMLEEATRTEEKVVFAWTIFTVVHGTLFDRFQQQTGTGHRIRFSSRLN